VTEEIIILKQELKKRTGISLDTVLGCKRLDAWLKLRGVYISYSTLSRIFGLSTLVIKPRERTLDELAAILGYPNFKEFARLISLGNSNAIIPFDLQFSFEHAIAERQLIKAASYYLEMLEHSQTAKVFSKDLANELYKDASNNRQALSLLASSSVGRDSFFLTFIDEDDLKGNYRKSLNRYFLPDASEAETQFVELFSLRKEFLAIEQLKWKDSSVLELENLKNIHLKSRAIELLFMRAKNVRVVQRMSEVSDLLERTILLLCECSNRFEELAVLGRFARGVLYAGLPHYIADHKSIIKALLSMLNQPIVDFEFQIPIYALLNKLNSLQETSIPQASSWPNAYYSSAIFLLSKEQRKAHELFFTSKVGIHKSFLYAY